MSDMWKQVSENEKDGIDCWYANLTMEYKNLISLCKIHPGWGVFFVTFILKNPLKWVVNLCVIVFI